MKCLGDFGSDDLTEYTDGEDGMGFKIKIKAPKITVKPIKVKLPTTTKGWIRDIGKTSGNLLREVNPLNITKNVMTKIPLLKDVYREVDKFTGGTITKLTNVSNLASKALRGKPISKAELIEAAMVAAQVGAIVASGGAASAYIGASAGALKNGPLGKTSLGRNLLTFAEIAGNAAAISQSASNQIAQQAGKTTAQAAAKQAATEVAKKTGREIAMEAAQKAVKEKAISMVKSKAEEEFEKKTGIPVGMATKIYNISSGKPLTAQTPKDILKVVAEDKLKKAGLGDAVTQAILSNNAAQLGVAIRNAPNLAIDKAKRDLDAQKIKLQSSLKLENMKKKIEGKAEKALKEATNAESIMAKIEKETNEQAKKLLQDELARVLSSFEKTQKEAVAEAEDYEIETAKASVEVAAAEEGRLAPSKAPLIAGVAGVAILSAGMLLMGREA